MNVRLIPASVGVKYGAADIAKLRSIGVLPVVVNDCYLQNKFRPERVQILFGGSGSGKSDWKATELLLKCMMPGKFCRVLFARKFREQVRDSQFLLFKGLIARYGLQDVFQIKESQKWTSCAARRATCFCPAGLTTWTNSNPYRT
jgi:hypothetical protein